MSVSPINCAVSACRERPLALTPSLTDGFELLILCAVRGALHSPLPGLSLKGQLKDTVFLDSPGDGRQSWVQQLRRWGGRGMGRAWGWVGDLGFYLCPNM